MAFRAVVSLSSFLAVGCADGLPRADTRPSDASSEAAQDAACRVPEHLVVESPDGSAPCGDVPLTILRENCTGGICHHAGTNPAGHMNLLSPCVAERLVGVVSSCNGRLLIDPAQPDRSFILEKLENDRPECGGERMPFRSRLPGEKIECVRRWIDAVVEAVR